MHEGVANNILGTYYLCSAARKHSSEAFVLVSTDKAVKPTSVMGATKRVAELIVKGFAARGGATRCAAVRFGNVLGSSGSVLEIFQAPVARGGPVTVTHEDVQRYFMTVEEAVQLILQAAAMARGGEIFVLKMGTPVRILEMAKNLILLSGLEPGKEIEIRITGLKQGEKLNEELTDDRALRRGSAASEGRQEAADRALRRGSAASEGRQEAADPADCVDSEHPSIMVLRSDDGVVADLDGRILDFEVLNRSAKPEAVVRRIRELAPTFTPASAHSLPDLGEPASA